MPQPYYKPLPAAAAALNPLETELLALWFYNQPIEFVLMEINYNLELPHPPGPKYPYPQNLMTYPIRTWTIPVLASDHMRRCALFFSADLQPYQVTAASMTLEALLYTKPDYRITSGTIITPKTSQDMIDLAYEVGIALYIVPARLQK